MLAVLKTLEPEFEAVERKRTTLSEALGLLSREGAAPSDQEVEQWLDERRMEKYS